MGAVPGNTVCDPHGLEAAQTLITSLPDGVLARIVQASDPDSRRQLRLASRVLRPLVDACTASLTLSAYSLPCLVSRGHLPDFAPEIRSVLLALQDTTAPAGFLAKLPFLGLSQLPHLTSLTLALANDHRLPRAAIADLAAALPPSTSRLVLTHMLGAGRPAAQPAGGALLPSAASAAATASPLQLDYSALRHLLRLCPQLREVQLEGGCWVRSDADLQALANLTSRPSGIAAATAEVAVTAASSGVEGAAAVLGSGGGGDGGGGGSNSGGAAFASPRRLAQRSSSCSDSGDGGGSGGGRGIVLSSIRGLYLDAADGYLSFSRTLAALSGLVALDVHLVATAVRQAPAVAAAADADINAGGILADLAAALNLAHLGLASEQLLRGLLTPALTGLTRLVVREFQGSTTALLGALSRLPLLAHLGLSGLDDAPYITDAHLELLALLPRLKYLAVDRLDISQIRLQQQQQQQSRFAGADPYFDGTGDGSSYGSSGGGGTAAAILPGLTGLEVALVVHSVPRLLHAFPSVQHLTLRWLWEQAMRKLAGWTSLTTLSLANLDCCLDWGLMRTLTGLTQLQLCRGSSYEQLAELLYLLRALPRLQVLRLSGWHCLRNSEPGRIALGLTTRLGTGAGTEAEAAISAGVSVVVTGGRGDGGVDADADADAAVLAGLEGRDAGDRSQVEPQRQPQPQPQQGQLQADARRKPVGAVGEMEERRKRQQLDAAAGGSASGIRASATASAPSSPCSSLSPSATAAAVMAAARYAGAGAGCSTSATMAAAFAALDPDLHRAWALIRAAADATAAAGAAMTLLRALPRLRALELTDCGHPLLRCLASRALLEDGGPLAGLRELRLSRLLDVVGGDVEEVVAVLPGLRRLSVQGCWPVDGEVLLQLEGLRRAGVDVIWRQ